MLNQIKKYFFTYGWLMIALFPIVLLFGRAPQNIFLGLYSAWGCFALYKSGAKIERKWIYLFLGVIATFGLSILTAHDSNLALRKWLHVSSQMIIFILMLTVISLNNLADAKIKRLFFWLGAGGTVGLLGLYIKWLVDFKKPGFEPTQNMVEDYLPLLTPFMLYFVNQLPLKRLLKWSLSVILVGPICFYIFYSNGRAALLGLCLAFFVYGSLVWRWRLYRVLLILGGILIAMIAVFPERFIRGAQNNHGTLEQKLNALSSGRIEIWMNVFKYSPPSLLTGVGLGNLRHIEGVTSHFGSAEAKNFHNFILNYWYETGLLGLTMLLIFIFWPVYNTLLRWRNLSPEKQQEAGVFLAAGIAILGAGLLNPTNLSPQFTVYLPLVLGGLICCTREQQHVQRPFTTNSQ